MRATCGLLLLICCVGAGCDQKLPLPQGGVARPDAGAELAGGTGAERDALRRIAMYLTFEKQAIELRRKQIEERRKQPRPWEGYVLGTPVAPSPVPQNRAEPISPPLKPTSYRDPVESCNDALTDRISARFKADEAALAGAAKLLKAPAVDGAMDEDHQAYLSFIAQSNSETSFAAEQALFHTDIIHELRAFISQTPNSAIRPWAEDVALELERRLGEITAGRCASN
jgi:hypothetical protein